MSQKPTELTQKLIAKAFEALTEPGMPPEARAELLSSVIQRHGEDTMALKLLGQYILGSDRMREMLESSPRRIARFLQRYGDNRVLALLENGQAAYPLIADASLAESLQCGDALVLDQHGAYVIDRIETPDAMPGATVVFERLISPSIAQVRRDHADMPEHVLLSASLAKTLAADPPRSGARLLVNIEQRLALSLVPPEAGEKRFRYLLDTPLPDIRIDRDLGDPPPVLFEILDDVRQEMTKPALRRRFKLQSGSFHMFAGASGTGKTYCVMALVSAIYDVMSQVVGVPRDHLPNRVMEMRSANMLSEWLGRAEKNLQAFVSELEEIAATPWTGPDGTQWNLPVICHLPEIDGIGRRRGHDDSAAMDRILSSYLDLFDPLRLAGKHIICIATSNLMDRGMIDEAMMRRLGGRVTIFRRLTTRPSFESVLITHLGIPLGHDGRQAREEAAALLADRIFGNVQLDPPLCEITLGGTASPLLKRRRDFLTHDLIRRAVQDATRRTCRTLGNENDGGDDIDGINSVPQRGVTAATLEAALDEQVRAVVAQLTEFNASSLTDLPDGARVAAVRRFDPPPSALQFQSIQRNVA